MLDFETTKLVTQCLHDFPPTYIQGILILKKKYFSNFYLLDCRPTWFSVSSEAPSPGGAGQRRRLYCGRRAVFCDALDTQGGAQSLDLRLDADIADAEDAEAEAEAASEARSGCGSRSSYSSSVFSASQSSLPRSRVSRVTRVSASVM